MRRLYRTMAILGTLSTLLGASPAPASPPLFEPDEPRNLATNQFPRAVWMGVIADERGTLFLVQSGDGLFEEGDPRPAGLVQAVTPVSLILAGGAQEVRALPGRPVPGARRLTLRDVLLVESIEYRHKLVKRGSRKTLGGELYLVGFEGGRAILQRDVEPAPSPAEQRLAAIPIVEVAPRVWEIAAGDLRKAMDSGEAVLKQALHESSLDISRDKGIGLEVKTPVADVRVDRRGFVVSSPNLASRAGLEVGDRILAVNALPIDGLGDLVRAYRSIKNDPAIQRVDLTIERQEKPQTLTYRVR